MNQDAWITSPLGVGAVITLLIWFCFWLDQKYRFFSFLGTAILVITGGAVLVNLHVIPSSLGESNPVYQFAGDYGVPLSIVLLLFPRIFEICADWENRRLSLLASPPSVPFAGQCWEGF